LWTTKVCPKLHPLRKYKTPVPNYTCDICDAYILKGATMYGCQSCDWDTCKNCLTRLGEDGSYRKNRHGKKSKFIHSDSESESSDEEFTNIFKPGKPYYYQWKEHIKVLIDEDIKIKIVDFGNACWTYKRFTDNI